MYTTLFSFMTAHNSSTVGVKIVISGSNADVWALKHLIGSILKKTCKNYRSRFLSVLLLRVYK